MKIDPNLEAIGFEVETCVDVTLRQLADKLAYTDSDIQGAFFTTFLEQLWEACAESTYQFEAQINALVNEVKHERKDSFFNEDWL